MKINKQDFQLKMLEEGNQSVGEKKIMHLSYKSKPNIIKRVNNKA